MADVVVWLSVAVSVANIVIMVYFWRSWAVCPCVRDGACGDSLPSTPNTAPVSAHGQIRHRKNDRDFNV